MNRLKFWRRERGLSQLELAAGSNVPRYAIQLCEQGVGELSPVHLDALAVALGVTTADLLTVDVSKKTDVHRSDSP